MTQSSQCDWFQNKRISVVHQNVCYKLQLLNLFFDCSENDVKEKSCWWIHVRSRSTIQIEIWLTERDVSTSCWSLNRARDEFHRIDDWNNLNFALPKTHKNFRKITGIQPSHSFSFAMCWSRLKAFSNWFNQIFVNILPYVSIHIVKNVKIKNCVFDMVCISGVIYVQTSSCCRKVSYRKWYIFYLVPNSIIAYEPIFQLQFRPHKTKLNSKKLKNFEFGALIVIFDGKSKKL